MSDESPPGRGRAAIEHEAHALVERRRYQQAQVVIQGGLREFPESVELQYLAGFIDYASERPQQAMSTVKALLSQAPHHYGARTLYAHLLDGDRQLVEAERVWIELLRDYPQSAECFAAYGQLMLATLHLEKARRLAQEGLRQSPNHAGCLYLASMIDLICHRRGTQSQNLQRMLHEHPEHVASARALIVALSARRNNRGALRVAQELLRHQPDSSQSLKLVRELKARTHWTMLPLYPIQRWGWIASIAITLTAVVGLSLAQQALSHDAFQVLLCLWIGYVIYSWTWPRLIRRWI